MWQTETYDLFPTLVQKHNITPQEPIVQDILDDNDLGEHGIIIGGMRSKSHKVLDNYPKIKEQIQNSIDAYTKTAGMCSIVIANSWYNIYLQGGSVQRHNHPGSIVSGAYYVHLELPSSHLLIENPNPHELWNNLTKYNGIVEEITVQKNDLLLFPSRLYHTTDPNESSKRVCVSFNTKYID
tara:strand:- start:1110 stop:1655 length:546 start_codon:yes stop_codon:yes gene_type:complete